MLVNLETVTLFPAHAGVILAGSSLRSVTFAVPRTRGGDPIILKLDISSTHCSPHTRG